MEEHEVQKEVSDKYSLRGRVYSKMKEDILKGKYTTDEAIKETKISKELGVSRTPVREALRQLELEELVTIVPNKGAFVTGISSKDIQDIYAIRSLIEGLSAKRATKNANETQINELEELLELAEFYLSKNNYSQLHELDSKFHNFIYELSDSRMLKHILTDLNDYAKRVRKASISSTGRAAISLEEHRAILEAIKNRDGKKAENLMNKHIKNTSKNVLAHKLEKIAEEAEEKEQQ